MKMVTLQSIEHHPMSFQGASQFSRPGRWTRFLDTCIITTQKSERTLNAFFELDYIYLGQLRGKPEGRIWPPGRGLDTHATSLPVAIKPFTSTAYNTTYKPILITLTH